MCITESLCYTTKIVTILQINYTSIKKIKKYSHRKEFVLYRTGVNSDHKKLFHKILLFVFKNIPTTLHIRKWDISLDSHFHQAQVISNKFDLNIKKEKLKSIIPGNMVEIFFVLILSSVLLLLLYSYPLIYDNHIN